MNAIFRQQQGWLQLGELALAYSFPVRLAELEAPEPEGAEAVAA